jgi:AsmA protein
MFLLPYLFPHKFNDKISTWANANISGKIEFGGAKLTFFKHFPNLTLTLIDVTLKGSAPYEQDTLVAAKDISLGIDLASLFKRKITINKIIIKDAFINVQVDSLGNANYNIYNPKQQNTNSASNDTTGASLGIKKIQVINSRVVYNDRSLPMYINAKGFNYLGSGDLSKEVFDLNTHTQIQSLDFSFNKQQYIQGKKFNADLVTEINTKSLVLVFQKNNLYINKLPVEFNGKFGFLKDGYEMDFNVDSHENNLSDIVTALPSADELLLNKTVIKGIGILKLTLKGRFLLKENIKPDLTLNLKVRNGYIANNKTPAPVQHIYLDFESKIPGLNPDSAILNLDSLHFKLDDGYLNAVLKIKGTDAPHIFTRVHAELDLEKWDKVLGLKAFHVKGKYSLHLLANGTFERKIQYKGLRKRPDTVLVSVPKFSLVSSFKEGYFKYDKLPHAISNISFNLEAECPDSDYKHISLSLDNLNISALDNYIKGYFKLANMDQYAITADLKTKLQLDELKKFYPIDSLELKGLLTGDFTLNGNYQPQNKILPLAVANINLKDGYVKTKYYPHPIENIQISTNITDNTGDLKGLNILMKPVTFTFEDEPFSIKAALHDFTDLQYKVYLKGILNVGSIYQVFSQKGYNVSGTIAANLSLMGKQSDAQKGNYDNLNNHGSLLVNNITIATYLYPKPFVISKGSFSFNQEKVQIDTLTLNYEHSVFVLNGYVANVLDYLLKPGSVLKGEMNLKSDLIVSDELMAFAGSIDTSKISTATSSAGASSSASQGVILIPKNLDLDFTADVKMIKYTDMLISDAKGHLMMKNDSLIMKETGFKLIGAQVNMDASYTDLNPQKAIFTYHIVAKDFDIKKAYNGIKLFHDIVTSAAHVSGQVSLDYQLSGILKSGMLPSYPTLKGGGVLSAEKLRMDGFGLFNAIGKEAKQDSLGSSGDVSKVELKTTLANNILTIERTKLRMAGFRARFEGQVSLDKQFNLKCRLGLPPLGLIGIPMTITGTEDKPIIHIGKGNNEPELQEKEVDD